jgi:nitrogen fixation protein FixH
MATRTYRPGDYRVMCELCGINYYRSECVKNHKGQIVCLETCYETRHPQELIKVRPDLARPADVRPDSNVTLSTTSAGNVTAADLHEYDGDPL